MIGLVTCASAGTLISDQRSGIMKKRPFNEPSDVSAEQGEVIVDGPDGVAVSLTPEAAVETSHRLLEQGVTAQGQLVQSGRHQDDERTAQD